MKRVLSKLLNLVRPPLRTPPKRVTRPVAPAASASGPEAMITALILLFQETAAQLDARQEPGMKQLGDFLRDFQIKRLMPLFRRVETIEQSRYVVAMVGLTNAGKSTLAEALLRSPVAPRRNAPATAIPVEYEHGIRWEIITHLADDHHVQTSAFVSAEELAKTLVGLVLDSAAIARRGISRVVVRGPMETLPPGLVFVDMPGCGAADSTIETNPDVSQNERLLRYLKSDVHEVHFCIGVDPHRWDIGTVEVEFFREIRHLCSTIIVTRWESDNAALMAEFKARFASLFPLCSFNFVAAKWAIAADAQNDIDKLTSSNIEEVRRMITDRASVENRRNLFIDQVIKACDDFEELARRPLQQASLKTVPWRADKLSQLRLAQANQEILLRITL